MIAAVLAAVALVGIVAIAALDPRQAAPSAVTSPTPSPTPTDAAETVAGATAAPEPTATAADATTAPPTGGRAETHESPLGYSVVLPAGWRHSEIQSFDEPVPNGDPEALAGDVFTSLSPDEERDAVNSSVNMTGPGPAQIYTAFVRIYRNSEGQTSREFSVDHSQGYGNEVVSRDEIMLADRGETAGGRPATRVTYDWGPHPETSVVIYVEDDQGRMWVIGFNLAGSPEEAPEGATREDLMEIITSFSAPWLRS